jgi:hypothetical protein
VVLQGRRQRISRRRLVASVAAAGALAASGIALAAPGDVIQTLNVAVSPDELPQKGGKNAELQIIASGCFEDTTPDCRGEAPQVPDVARAVISLDRKDITLNPDEARQCKSRADEIADQDTAQAESECGRRSVIGRGFAVFNQGQSVAPADVTAFNGRAQRGNPTVLLHAYASSLQLGTAPVGVLKPGNKLDVKIDPLPGGSRLATFGVDIKKGKYVQARCTRGREITTTSKWTYRDAPDQSVAATQPCRVRK